MNSFMCYFYEPSVFNGLRFLISLSFIVIKGEDLGGIARGKYFLHLCFECEVERLLACRFLDFTGNNTITCKVTSSFGISLL